MADFRAQIIDELPHLRRYARALLCGDVDAADDLVQASVERALSRRGLWRRRGRLRSWLFTIMHNIFVNDVTTAARRRALLAERRPLETETAPDHELRLEALDVMAAIGRLPEEFRAALCLVTLEDFSYEEAATILGVPVGTLMSRLHRARAQLRDMTGAEARPRLKRVK